MQKYEMPQAEYAARTDSVLAWKKKDQLGRFDPAAVGAVEARVRGWQRDVEERGMFVSSPFKPRPFSLLFHVLFILFSALDIKHATFPLPLPSRQSSISEERQI